MWAIMKVQDWGNVTTAQGIRLMAPPDGPHAFIPVFATREQAIKWNGAEANIAEVETKEESDE
jgi:hypothetical protein